MCGAASYGLHAPTPSMSSDEKPPKPLPSADEIAAYLEQSAARTRKRLTIAKAPSKNTASPPAKRVLQVQKQPASTAAGQEHPRPSSPRGAADDAVEAWRPPSPEQGD